MHRQKPEHQELCLPARYRLVWRAVAALFPALVICGCSSSLSFKVEPEIPTPLTVPIAVVIGIYYPEGFGDYIYQENTDERPNWAISIGASQTRLFDEVLTSMFRKVVHIDSMDDPDERVDGIISPNLAQVQFAIPEETRTDIYEAWVKYDMKLFDRNGELVAEWPITGYGKTSNKLYKRRAGGLNFAMNLALRDAGAKLVLGLRSIDGVQAWLAAAAQNCNNEIRGC